MRFTHGVLVFAFFSALVASAGERREPWDWTDQERIAELTDDAKAAARVKADRARNPKAEREMPPGAMKPYDIIDGKHDSHLYPRLEVFDYLTRAAFADELRFRELYREMREETRIKLGLPDDFWQRFEAITAPYRADRRRQWALASSNLPPAERAAEEEALEPLLCHGRKAALAEAERAFGPALDRFLYTAVARKMRTAIFRKPDDKYRQEMMGECP